jgi:hypothetical protein
MKSMLMEETEASGAERDGDGGVDRRAGPLVHERVGRDHVCARDLHGVPRLPQRAHHVAHPLHPLRGATPYAALASISLYRCMPTGASDMAQ